MAKQRNTHTEWKWYCQYYFTTFLHGTFEPPAPMTHNTVFS